MSVFPSKHRTRRRHATRADATPGDSAQPLEALRRCDLMAMAKARGLTPRRTARRDELIAALQLASRP